MAVYATHVHVDLGVHRKKAKDLRSPTDKGWPQVRELPKV